MTETNLDSSPEVSSSQKREVISQSYEVDGVSIAVRYQSIMPNGSKDAYGEVPNLGSVIIFLPGWSQAAGDKSDELIGLSFANAGNREALVIDTKPDKNVNGSLYKEAEAISRLVKEKGIKSVIIAGHSEGGIKAVDLAVILQKQKEAGETDTTIEGIILEESVGLYDQGSALGFVGNFAKDGVLDAHIHMIRRRVMQREGIRNSEARNTQLTRDVIFGTLREVVRKKIRYPKRLLSQIKELKSLNSHLGEVKVPVILVNGVNDLASNPEKVFPGYRDLENREEALKRELFQNSPYIRWVTPKRLATHAMPVLRAEQIAKASLYMLKRSRRSKEQIPPAA